MLKWDTKSYFQSCWTLVPSVRDCLCIPSHQWDGYLLNTDVLLKFIWPLLSLPLKCCMACLAP